MVRTIDTLVGKMSMLRVASEISIYMSHCDQQWRVFRAVTCVQCGHRRCGRSASQRSPVRPSPPSGHACISSSLHDSTNQPTNQPTKPTGRTGRARAASREPRSRTSSGGGEASWRRRVSRAPLPRLWGDWQWQLTGGVHKSPRRCTVSRTAVLFARTRACVRSPPDTPRPPRTSGPARPSKLGSQIRWEQPQSMKKKKPWRLIALLMSHMYSWE